MEICGKLLAIMRHLSPSKAPVRHQQCMPLGTEQSKLLSLKNSEGSICKLITGQRPVDLYLNFEKSSWKTQVPPTGFLAQAVKIQFEID